jgi:MFS family permease
VLRERNLLLLFGSNVVSTLGTGMAQVALAFVVLEIGTASDLGFVLLAREVPTVVFLLLGGLWADRVPRKLLLVGGDVARGLAQASVAAMLLTGTAGVLSVALFQVVFGVVSAFTRPATTGIVPEAVARTSLQTANALFDLSRSTLQVVGPAAGAALVVTVGPAWALAADACSFGVSGLLLSAMRIPRRTPAVPTRILEDLRTGWREFVGRTWVWTMVVGFGFFQLTLFPALLVLGPYVAKTELGGAGAWGAILASQAAGSVVGGIAALRYRPTRPLLAATLLTLPCAVLLALLGAAPPVPVICAVAVVASACLSTTDIVWYTTLQAHVPTHAISRISSFDWLGSVALNPIGYASVGPLAGAIGVAPTLYGAALVNAAVAVAVALVPSVREVGAGAEPAAQPS